MILKIYPENPNPKAISQVVDCLRKGGIVIFPTDTVYGIGCDITNHRAVEKICKIKNIDPSKVLMSFICHDLRHISNYTKPISNTIFRVLKQHLPGPFTFVLNATSNVPKILNSKRKTVGIRVPDNQITLSIVKELGNPMLSTSVIFVDGDIESATDPELIHEKYEGLVDIVIDGGYGGIQQSTIVDCSSEEIEVIRQGKGILII